jgi:poly-beta-1,6-N-acetyl-D-glucosamine synthase
MDLRSELVFRRPPLTSSSLLMGCNMRRPSYVLITPVRNEEGTIEITIQSVVSQTLLPREWVIVSDQSTDSTDLIVRRYETRHEFLRLVRVERASQRSFASVVHATETGLRALQNRDYEYVGLLDADVRFKADYYETLIGRFAEDPNLGLAGGLVLDLVDGKLRRHRQYLRDVAGATQFFRRDCFASLGGLVAIPEGGWDAITCMMARMNGYRTATFPDLVVEHLRPRNAAEGNMVRRYWQLGIRDYALGGHPLFEVFKCLSRSFQFPPLIEAGVRFAGFAWCILVGRKRSVPAKILRRIQDEQMKRILPNRMLKKR